MSKEEFEKQGYKTYENDEIRVYWNPDICKHAGRCVEGNDMVFDPSRRPWIDLSQANAMVISSIIDQCPSKALQYELKVNVSIVFEESSNRSAAYNGDELIGSCEFRSSQGIWTITHTTVNQNYQGQGIAKRLVESVIAEARAKGAKILPLCSYAKNMMIGKSEYDDILIEK